MIRKLLFLFVLLFPSFAFGQAFVNVSDPSLYPAIPSDRNVYIPTSSEYAILAYRIQPIGAYRNIVSVDIIPSVNYKDVTGISTFGWTKSVGSLSDPDSYQIVYQIIDSSTLYSRTSSVPSNSILTSIQTLLVEKNLGTVQQRAAYIASFKLSNVSIIDTSKIVESIVSMLGPWANIGIGIAIALFGIDLGTRKSKKIAGQAAKEARAAERREINKEIRQDPIAAQFRTHLGNLSSVIRDTYGLHGTDSRTRREARALFEQAAKDYAAYKKYRGWTS